jgi:uncharacterized protein
MRALSVITLLAALVFTSGHASPSPAINISAEELQTLRTWAAQGNALAQYKLGQLYQFALGVSQNYAEATKWYEKAAARGDADAQFSLGLMYAIGDGVRQDDVRAYMWWSLAAAHSTGHKQKSIATQRDGALTRRMTTAQVAEAQRLLQQCQVQQFKGC